MTAEDGGAALRSSKISGLLTILKTICLHAFVFLGVLICKLFVAAYNYSLKLQKHACLPI
jgi:hypothetical protein